MNKIGTLDIIKAYLGNKELTANNAYMGETPLIPDTPTPPTGAKYVKVSNDWVPANGDKIVFVWTSVEYSDGNGGVATFPVNPTTSTSSTALLLSDYKIQINGDEFPESELNNITKAYYYSSTSTKEYDVSAAVFTIEYDSGNTGFFFLKNENNYLRTGEALSTRTLICDSDGTTNALWDSQKTSNNKIVLHNNRSKGTNVYLRQGIGGSDTRNKWMSNYGSSQSNIPDIYKLVTTDA